MVILTLHSAKRKHRQIQNSSATLTEKIKLSIRVLSHKIAHLKMLNPI